MSEIQTRSEKTGLKFFATLAEAFAYAKRDITVWKLSYNKQNQRVRLVRSGNQWRREDLG